MDKDSWMVVIAFVVIAMIILGYLSWSGDIPIDWNAVFNIKEYPKD